jgi:hypothetical protein
MPDTPNFAITYPCMDATINCDSFRELATDVESAFVVVDAEAAATLNLPYARIGAAQANPAFGVEAIMTYGIIPASDYVNGITVNSGAGTMTIVTPGVYQASAQNLGNQSTLTITSQRLAVYVNGVLQMARKYRGTNPATAVVLSGTYTANIGPLAAGDVVTFRYLWTGTGALSSPAGASVVLSFLTTP